MSPFLLPDELCKCNEKNSVGPDQTDPNGAVLSGITLLAQNFLLVMYPRGIACPIYCRLQMAE